MKPRPHTQTIRLPATLLSPICISTSSTFKFYSGKPEKDSETQPQLLSKDFQRLQFGVRNESENENEKAMVTNAIIAHLRNGTGKVSDSPAKPVKKSSDNPGTAVSAHLRKQTMARSGAHGPITSCAARPLEQSKTELCKSLLPLDKLMGNSVATSLGGGAQLQTMMGTKSSPFVPSQFLAGLRRMLSHVETTGDSGIVSWGPRGLTFIVRNKVLFGAKIAPKYFETCSYSTFRLALQTLGFAIDHDFVSGFEVYYHPDFARKEGSTIASLRDATTKSSLPLEMYHGAKQSATQQQQQQQRSVCSTTNSTTNESSIKKFLSQSRRASNAAGGDYSAVRSVPAIVGALSSISKAVAISSSKKSSATVELLKASSQSRRHSAPCVPPAVPASVPKEVTAAAAGGSASSTNTGPDVTAQKTKTGINVDLGLLAKRKLTAECKNIQGPASAASVVLHGMGLSSTTGATSRNMIEDLHKILLMADTCGYSHVISWIPHGRAFKVHNERDFVKTILPMFTNKTAFSSFQGALERYGFKQIGKGPDKGAWFHPLFVRDLPLLCKGKTSLQMKASAWKNDSTPNFFLK